MFEKLVLGGLLAMAQVSAEAEYDWSGQTVSLYEEDAETMMETEM